MPAYKHYEHFYVLNNKSLLPPDMTGKTYFVTHSERDWTFLVNLWEAYQILRTERPDIILSTGAGIAVPFAIAARFLPQISVIFVETMTRVSAPSLTGKIMYYLAHRFYYQHAALKTYFPRAIYGGTVI